MQSRSPQVLPRLLAMLQAQPGDVDERIRHALAVLVEQTDIDTAFVSRFVQGRRHFTHTAGRPLPPGSEVPVAVEETVCRLIATGELEPLVTDVSAHPLLIGHPHVTSFGVAVHVGVPLVVDGDIVGAVCAIAAEPRPGLNDRDADRLATVAQFIGQVLAPTAALGPAPDHVGAVPADGPPVDEPAGAPSGPLDMAQLAEAVAAGGDLEALTRPLLELLHASTGLESTYLTFVDWPGDQQEIVHSLNTGSMAIPEGLKVPWNDTLCRRSLDAGISYTRDVPAVWGDSEAARALGIRTYVSVPLRDADEAVIGTLCGASSSSVDLDEQHLLTMQLFGRVLTDQISRERAGQRERARVERLDARIRPLRRLASTDGLTGLFNRIGIGEWLTAVISTIEPSLEQLALAVVDIDGFAAINRTHGPDVGDEVLRHLATALSEAGRGEDLLGRLGDDRFVVAALLPATDASFGSWAHRRRRDDGIVYHGAQGQQVPVHVSVGAITIAEPDTDPWHALEVAEQTMRRRKPAARVPAS